MNAREFIIRELSSATGKKAVVVSLSAALGWVGSTVKGWWQSRDRYQAHVTRQMTDTIYGNEELPVIVIQSVHSLPINVTRVRLRNGFRWKLDQSPFYSESYDDYPTLPRQIDPYQSTKFWLDSSALQEARKQSRLLEWLWVPRVYIGVQTMGRGERLFVAEGGLKWGDRRKRNQH